MVYSQTTGVIISASQPNFPKSTYTDLEVVVLVPNHQRDTGFSPVRCYCRTSSHDYHGASSSEVELISLYSNPFIHNFSLYLSASPNIHTHKLGVICMIMIRLNENSFVLDSFSKWMKTDAGTGTSPDSLSMSLMIVP